MRHTLAFLGLCLALGPTGWAVDAIAGRSPAPGVVIAWSNRPAELLAALPAGQASVVNSWLSGRIIQLHVDSMRAFDSSHLRGAVVIRLPDAGIVLAGCG